MSANAGSGQPSRRSTVCRVPLPMIPATVRPWQPFAPVSDSGGQGFRRPCAACQRASRGEHRTRASRPALDRKRQPFDRAGSVRACQRFGSSGKPRRRIPQPFDRWPEASASRKPVASRPRRIRHHRRKRATNARRCVRPRRTGSRPPCLAVRLQGRLTPLESVRQFRPMSAGKDSGKPRNRSTAPEASGLSAVRKSPPSEAATVCRKRTPPPSNAGKPSGFRSKAATVGRATVRPCAPPVYPASRHAGSERRNAAPPVSGSTVRAASRFR